MPYDELSERSKRRRTSEAIAAVTAINGGHDLASLLRAVDVRLNPSW
jgi:hypothetical protein